MSIYEGDPEPYEDAPQDIVRPASFGTIHAESPCDKLAEALAKARTEFKTVVESGNNPHFNSSYAKLVDVVEMADPILAKNGLSVVHLFRHGPLGLELVSRLLHASGQYLDSVIPIDAGLPPQKFGATATYWKRYNYTGLLSIVADEDDDGNAAQDAAKDRPARPTQAPRSAPRPAGARPAQSSGGGRTISDGQRKMAFAKMKQRAKGFPGNPGDADTHGFLHQCLATHGAAVDKNYESLNDLPMQEFDQFLIQIENFQP